jgi:hypothetical protein
MITAEQYGNPACNLSITSPTRKPLLYLNPARRWAILEEPLSPPSPLLRATPIPPKKQLLKKTSESVPPTQGNTLVKGTKLISKIGLITKSIFWSKWKRA